MVTIITLKTGAMSASTTNDISVTTAGGHLKAHTSTSVSRSVGKNHRKFIYCLFHRCGNKEYNIPH